LPDRLGKIEDRIAEQIVTGCSDSPRMYEAEDWDKRAPVRGLATSDTPPTMEAALGQLSLDLGKRVSLQHTAGAVRDLVVASLEASEPLLSHHHIRLDGRNLQAYATLVEAIVALLNKREGRGRWLLRRSIRQLLNGSGDRELTVADLILNGERAQTFDESSDFRFGIPGSERRSSVGEGIFNN
jgi:hypothetical protein